MNTDLDNRWSDAARQAALAVRKARAFAANPRKDNPTPKRGGLAPKPMVYAGGSATFDERTGKRIEGNVKGNKPIVKVPYAKDTEPGNPGLHIWIPPNGGVGTQYEDGMKDLVTKKKLLASNTLPKPHIFYSSTGPKGPLDRQAPQGILRYDPKNPVDASKLGYNMGTGTKSMPPMPPKTRVPKKTERTDGMRYIIGGKRYTRVGNKLTPDVVEKGKVSKVFYEM